MQNIKQMLSLLPDATVCVAREEEAAYRKVVPEKQLLLHDNLVGLVNIRNWLNATIQEDCLVQVDDDLLCVRTLVGKSRKIIDPAVIAQIIENAHRISADLDIGVFCWSRSQNTVMLRPEYRPVRFAAPLAAAYGLRGAARRRTFRTDLKGREDFDFTLQTLLDDRILFMDTRFYFDFGRAFSGTGGNVGIISSEQFARSGKLMRHRWGRFISLKAPGFVKNRSSDAMSVRVCRANPVIEANLARRSLT